jgi:hypothetical protein
VRAILKFAPYTARHHEKINSGRAFIVASPGIACINDRDTLAQEAAAQKSDSSGLPNVARVITGRFERNPPLYYEMRLKRVAQEIKINPTKLGLYDDAGAASDRLHHSREAIEWMERKRKQLESSKIDPKLKREHLYRYFANAGTFHAHLWLRSGANRKDMREMKIGRDMIKRAIEIKPNAHFGRERYQLLLMEWVLNPPPTNNREDTLPNDFLNLVSLDGGYGVNALKTSNYPDAIIGLNGLIVLGDAWNSFDVFYALSKALEAQNDASLSELARQRYLELLNEGRSSLSPNFKTELDDLPASLAINRSNGDISQLYSRLRADAVSYQYLRESYMNARLREGLHPDTHSNFWKDWKEPQRPSLEMPDSAQAKRGESFKLIKRYATYLLVGFALLCTGIMLGRRQTKRTDFTSPQSA